MSCRPAVLLTSAQPDPRPSLFAKSAKERAFLFNDLRTLCSLLRSQSEAHPLCFQSLPHSFAKTPGCHYERSAKSSSFALSGVPTRQSRIDLRPSEPPGVGDARLNRVLPRSAFQRRNG